MYAIKFSVRAEVLTGVLFLCSWLVCVAPVQAGWESDPVPGTTSGTLYLKSSPDAPAIEALRIATAMHAEVTGSLARVHVVQTFVNAGEDWAEGLYVFPLSADAAVDELLMTVGDRTVRGDIQEKARAQATYAAARDAGKTASVVDQERPNMFTTAVANIAPHGSVSVEISYLETVPFRDARYTLRLPLAITPRYTPGAALDPTAPLAAANATLLNSMLGTVATPERVTAVRQNADITVDLAPGFTVGSVTSLQHVVDVEGEIPGRSIHLTGTQIPSDRDFELVWTPAAASEPVAGAFVEHDGTAGYALLVLTPPETIKSGGLPREVTFIIDTSGSMEGPSIEQARAALRMGVDRLQPADRFNVIRFASDDSSLFTSPQAVNATSRAAASAFISGLRADGGTEMRAPLEHALNVAPSAGLLKQIVFITDGSVGNENELVALIHRRIGDARLFTVGIGAAPNVYFLKEAAAAGRGSYTVIAQREQVASRMQDLFRKLEHPALVDLAVQWPDGARADLAEPLPGDLYEGDPLVISARVSAASGTFLTVTGRVGGTAWTQQVPLVVVGEKAGLSKLWARERIADLSRALEYGGDRDTLRTSITTLALAHHLVSEFTSLVAVDDVVIRPPGGPGHVEQVPTSAPSGSYWQTAGFAKTATPSQLLFACGLFLMLIGGLRLWPRAATACTS